jgi:hypothetical protein
LVFFFFFPTLLEKHARVERNDEDEYVDANGEEVRDGEDRKVSLDASFAGNVGEDGEENMDDDEEGSPLTAKQKDKE